MITFLRGYFMNKHDDDVIDHDELYELDSEIVVDLEHLIKSGDKDLIDPVDDDAADEQPVENTIRVRFHASLNGYRRGDEVTVSVDDQLFSGLIKQRLVEVI